jgi:hypothetical protein
MVDIFLILACSDLSFGMLFIYMASNLLVDHPGNILMMTRWRQRHKHNPDYNLESAAECLYQVITLQILLEEYLIFNVDNIQISILAQNSKSH